jgi:hypothetical protein
VVGKALTLARQNAVDKLQTRQSGSKKRRASS